MRMNRTTRTEGDMATCIERDGPRRSNQMTRLSVMASLALLLCSGCGSGGTSRKDLASGTAQEILASSEAAAAAANSVVVASKSSQGRLNFALALRLTGNGGQAKITLLGRTTEVIRVGHDLYVKGGPTLYRRLRITRKLPSGTWLKTSVTGPLRNLAAFTEVPGVVDRLLTASGAVTKGGTAILRGQHALRLDDGGKLFKGSIYVAATGRPYPIMIKKAGIEAGRTIFSSWNRPVAVGAPEPAVSLEAARG